MPKKKPTKKTTKKATTQKGMSISLGKPKKIETKMDPKLQHILLDMQQGRELESELVSSTESGAMQLDVIAKLENPEVDVPGFKISYKIGQIVTGSLLVSDIEKVRQHENVLSLKSATTLKPELDFSVSEINADPATLDTLPENTNTGAIDGSGVVVGVIDYGCDFVHDNFRNGDGSTRLISLWDQTGGNSTLSPAPFGYGREFDTAVLDAALGANNPYSQIAYNPGSASHGTHVMDIAAGNGRATGHPGVAPNADLIFVHIAHGDLVDDDTFGNSKMLLEAVAYIFAKAKELGKPCSINISLGTHGGPHDGSTLAEQAIDELLRQTPGRALAISAGNSWDNNGHASGSISVNGSDTLGWSIKQGDFTNNELEVWYPGAENLEVTLVTPDGGRLGPVALGSTVDINSNNTVVGRIVHRNADPNNGDNHIDILLDAALPKGEWGVELKNVGTNQVNFHSWIERDDRGQSRFVDADVDASHTIGSISCGELSIAVGSYLSGLPSRELSPFSAEGPTRDGKQKPEVSAPGQFLHPFWQQGIKAARSLSQGSTRMSGTSMASPHVAGLIALIAQVSPQPLTTENLRKILLEAVRNNPPIINETWNSRYGFGRVDAVESLRQVIPTSPPPAEVGVGDLIAAVPPQHLEPNSGWLSELLRVAGETQSKVSLSIEIEPKLQQSTNA